LNIHTRTVWQTAVALIACSAFAYPAVALAKPTPKHKFDIPPPAELQYSIRAKQNGFTLGGNATLQWNVTDSTYSVSMETRAMLIGKIIESKSEGSIDAHGLAPAEFTEKRLRKKQTVTTFNRSAKIISFTQSGETYPIKGGEQDRDSIIWQLISIARGTPHKFTSGSEWVFFVADQRDAEPWTFIVMNEEKISTTLGELDAVHIVRAPPPDSNGKQLDIWLAPSLGWYPLRLRFIDRHGNTIEQTLESISKK